MPLTHKFAQVKTSWWWSKPITSIFFHCHNIHKGQQFVKKKELQMKYNIDDQFSLQSVRLVN